VSDECRTVEKVFLGRRTKFSRAVMRFVRDDVRDLVAQKNDHGLSYRR
jgi:hypothetical protein